MKSKNSAKISILKNKSEYIIKKENKKD